MINRILVWLVFFTALSFGKGMEARAGSAGRAVSGGKVKVFILAGQSNMQGQGFAEDSKVVHIDQPNGTLAWLIDNAETHDDFKHLKQGGAYVRRSDVWVRYKVDAKLLKSGPLSVNFGAHDTLNFVTIGPELGFGWVTGDSLADQVLLIKTAWGGKSLAKDFRPPSSGGTVGPYYTQMIAEVQEALGKIAEYVPGYHGQGYEIDGFGWHQGWNDYVDSAFVDQYEANIKNFIRDVRKDLHVPKLPFVIAESGMACYDEKNQKAQKLCAAQASPAVDPEFKGTVAAVRTRQYYDSRYWPFKNFGFHWHGSFYSYYKVGRDMGVAMMGLLPKPAAVHPAKTGMQGPGFTLVSRHLTLDLREPYGLEILDASGLRVFSFWNDGPAGYDLSKLRSGMYLLKLTRRGVATVSKLAVL